MRFFLGGYGADMGGDADGIGVLHAGAPDDALAGGELAWAGTAAAAASPSWLAWHPTLDVVYAAQEGHGDVQAFRRTGPGTFAPLGPAVPVGDSVCHVAVSPSGASLIASCYGDGRVVRVALDATGAPATVAGAAPGAPAAGAASVDPHAGLGEERAPHAHQATFVPGGFVSTDLGFDSVRVWSAPAAGEGSAPALRQTVTLPRGSGPRHAVWHPSGHLYVVTEYSNEVFVLRPGADGAWMLVAGAPLVGTEVGVDFPAEIALSRDGRFAVVGVRGSNTLATLRVTGDGGSLASTALVESGVDWPRHHVIARDTVLVAGQRSAEIASLTLDERTGVPGRVRRRVEAPTPTALLADR